MQYSPYSVGLFQFLFHCFTRGMLYWGGCLGEWCWCCCCCCCYTSSWPVISGSFSYSKLLTPPGKNTTQKHRGQAQEWRLGAHTTKVGVNTVKYSQCSQKYPCIVSTVHIFAKRSKHMKLQCCHVKIVLLCSTTQWRSLIATHLYPYVALPVV